MFYTLRKTIWLLCILVLPAIAWAETIRITNGEWAPYLSRSLPQHGAASHIVSEAFSAAGITTQYGFFPWKRSYKLAIAGTWNGTVVWIFTEERARDFYYSDVVIADAEHLFHLKAQPLEWIAMGDLKGKTIGTTLHTVHPQLEQAQTEGILKIQRAGNYDNLYNRLLKKRIDAIPNVLQVGLYFLRTTMPPEQRALITYARSPVEHRTYHLILSKKVPENRRFLALFNQGLEKIKANGKYQEILNNMEKGAYDTAMQRHP